MQPSKEHPLVFFTGGTALRNVSRSLADKTLATVHLVTPFDSGGSTARLRSAFAMPAIGDMRNRLLALASPDPQLEPMLHFLDYRLPKTGESEALRQELYSLRQQTHPLWQGMQSLEQTFLHSCFEDFLRAMPKDFDAHSASLGNLCMAGCYLRLNRNINAVLSSFSRLLKVRGEVLPVIEESLHLAACLQDGSILVGQHHFKRITQPIKSIFLTVHEPRVGVTAKTPCCPRASAAVLQRLRKASMICYPMGSFYSSLVATLLPEGIGKTIAAASCPKVYVPNTGFDPEMQSLSLQEAVGVLLKTLLQDCPHAEPQDVLSHILLDTKHGQYNGYDEAFVRFVRANGITLLDQELILPQQQRHSPEQTAEALLAICIQA